MPSGKLLVVESDPASVRVMQIVRRAGIGRHRTTDADVGRK
jgi:hypothetical protein